MIVIFKVTWYEAFARESTYFHRPVYWYSFKPSPKFVMVFTYSIFILLQFVYTRDV
jgi:hypothetical protein